MKNYTDYPTLADVYLEDSYVLEISEAPSELKFSLEAVLTPHSPEYHAPAPGEQYAYARGDLIFTGVTRVNWASATFRRYTDAAGEEDLGNIDSLTNDGGIFFIEGDWGKVMVWSDSEPIFVLKGTE